MLSLKRFGIVTEVVAWKQKLILLKYKYRGENDFVSSWTIYLDSSFTDPEQVNANTDRKGSSCGQCDLKPRALPFWVFSRIRA